MITADICVQGLRMSFNSEGVILDAMSVPLMCNSRKLPKGCVTGGMGSRLK